MRKGEPGMMGVVQRCKEIETGNIDAQKKKKARKIRYRKGKAKKGRIIRQKAERKYAMEKEVYRFKEIKENRQTQRENKERK